jgi:hypothetical protein
VTLHRRDLVSLFFGLVFTLCGLAFLNRSEDWDVFESGGLLAVGLIAIGALGVVLVLTGARHGRSRVEPDSTAATTDESTERSPDELDMDLPGFDDPYGPDDQLDPT